MGNYLLISIHQSIRHQLQFYFWRPKITVAHKWGPGTGMVLIASPFIEEKAVDTREVLAQKEAEIMERAEFQIR